MIDATEHEGFITHVYELLCACESRGVTPKRVVFDPAVYRLAQRQYWHRTHPGEIPPPENELPDIKTVYGYPVVKGDTREPDALVSSGVRVE